MRAFVHVLHPPGNLFLMGIGTSRCMQMSKRRRRAFGRLRRFIACCAVLLVCWRLGIGMEVIL